MLPAVKPSMTLPIKNQLKLLFIIPIPLNKYPIEVPSKQSAKSFFLPNTSEYCPKIGEPINIHKVKIPKLNPYKIFPCQPGTTMILFEPVKNNGGNKGIINELPIASKNITIKREKRIK